MAVVSVKRIVADGAAHPDAQGDRSGTRLCLQVYVLHRVSVSHMHNHVARWHTWVMTSVRPHNGSEIEMDRKFLTNRIHIDNGDVDVQRAGRSGFGEYLLGVWRNTVQQGEDPDVQESRSKQQRAERNRAPAHFGRALLAETR